MTLNDSIRYENDHLTIDGIAISEIAAEVRTPVYIYSKQRILKNLDAMKTAFSRFDADIHYSVKANGNLSILRILVEAGAGIDAVSGGEIFRALKAGAPANNIVYAGVGKTESEIAYAVEQNVGWFNVENTAELEHIQAAAKRHQRESVQIALRLNPEVTASTHPYIATGHGGAKFGLTADVIEHILKQQGKYPELRFSGIHIHIGSQLHDTTATTQAVEKALDIIKSYPDIRTVNIGGGFPARYQEEETLPSLDDFARVLHPLLKDYKVIIEPGRSIIADAGILVTRILYRKRQGGQTFIITDASMTELIRPALYQAEHTILAVQEEPDMTIRTMQITGPVCETADMLGRNVMIPNPTPGSMLAILSVGAYGIVMASNYNARPRPSEVLVDGESKDWKIVRQRETWDDLIRGES